MADPDSPRQRVDAVIDPLLHRTLEALGMVRAVETGRRGARHVRVALPVAHYPLLKELDSRVTTALASHGNEVTVDYEVMGEEETAALISRLRREVGPGMGETGSRTRVIAVASGKGGVGKSSVTTNLAVALAALGHRVGVIDADIWGFSIPRMLGVAWPPVMVANSIIPPEAHGVKAMSMDYFVGEDQAVIWRGPMLHKAMEQFLKDVFWDDPEFLLVDMPPGTGDISISMSQFLPRAQVLLVTTPQPTAQRVARRAALMAAKVNQEVLGVVENMSYFTGDDGTRYAIFGEGGGRELADELDVPLMAQIPLLPPLRAGADEGKPVTEAAPGSEADEAFRLLAEAVVARRPRIRTHPELVIH